MSICQERIFSLRTALEDRILVLDGATGTWLQAQDLSAEDFGGPELDGCNENLVRQRPDVVAALHRAYLEAGADLVETNTFGATPVVLAEYGLEGATRELNLAAARIAREAADAYSTPRRPRWVAGSMGPTTKAISVTGGISFAELLEGFYEQAQGLVEGGVDVLLVETSQDTRNVKAALLGIDRLFAELGERVPVMVSCTIEPMGTMLAGQSVEAFAISLDHVELLSLGLNCGTGPDFMTDHVRSLAALAPTGVSCVPNAGLPDADGRYLEGPAVLAATLERFVDRGWLNFVGGCCGTTPEHIRELVRMVEGKRPRRANRVRRTVVSGVDFVELSDDNRPLLVGERTNVIGSRKFKRLICDERFEDAAEVARAQVKGGGQVIDVCLADPDRDERHDMERFLDRLIRAVRAPLMIDSTDEAVIELALTYCQGKAIINSVNLEDGEERFEKVLPLVRRYGAALVVGTIDEVGMAVGAGRKLEIARRSHQLITEKYGVPSEDIIWDPLTFPCATGDENYIGSAAETIEGIRAIKAEFPSTKTILGVSNVSFGLPVAGREVLNAVFLYHCTKAGLDLAIVNTQRLERYASIDAVERGLSEDLLFNRGDDPVAAFAAHFRGAGSRFGDKVLSELSLDERLAQYIVEGAREGLTEDLNEKLKDAAPLEIINGPLMRGMDEVGRLFNDNQLIVAEVLQSAESMKLAVAHLEPHMDKNEVVSRGKVLLATVKGDVHDIGKNLVEIILSNNGFEVVNLGIKVPPATLIQAVREHRPDAVGLSGLLVKSAHQMVVTAQDLAAAGIEVPVLVGGAALSNRFTRTRIAPVYEGTVAYARDAMAGLAMMGRLSEGQALEPEVRAEVVEPAAASAAGEAEDPGNSPRRRIRRDIPAPPVPDCDRHVLADIPPDHVWPYLNPQVLYGRHLGAKGKIRRLMESGDGKVAELVDSVRRVQDDWRRGPMRVSAVWRFFAVRSWGNTIGILDPDEPERTLRTMEFPRQRGKDGLCLSDFVSVSDRDGGSDHVAFFVTTAGAGILERSARAREAGEFLESHIWQALAVETAEAAAEWLHARLRGAWGFPDDVEMSMLDRFRARYRGKRFSFGYPACPDLSLQRGLFDLLKPADIGLHLTDGDMMEPEASVSALVFHHPDATYFGVGRETMERG